MLITLSRRIQSLEARRPVWVVPTRMMTLGDFSPEVRALWIAMDGDINKMNLAQLDLVAADLRRMTE